jgi:hypothetical protein
VERLRQRADVRHVQVQGAQIRRLAEDLARRAVERDLPLAHHHDAVGGDGLAHEVGDCDDGDALGAVQLVCDLQHFVAAQRVEHGRGLVEHDHRRVHRQHAGNADALLLPAGEHVRRPHPVGLHAHLFQRPVHATGDLLPRHAQVFRPKGHILLDDGGHDLVVRLLKDHAHGAADGAQVAALARIPFLHPDVALRRQQQPVEVPGQRRFARTVVADDDHILARLDGQVDASQRVDGALALRLVGVVEIFNADDGRHGRQYSKRRASLQW